MSTQLVANKALKLFFAELSANLMFTTSYLILVGRIASENFSLSHLETGLGVALIYFAAMYVSSYRYSADIFVFYSLYRCLRNKSYRPLYINVPGQIAGTVLGFGLYALLHKYLLALSPFATFESITTFQFDDLYLKYFTFGLFVFILTYLMAITKVSFELQRIAGTLIVAFVVFIITSLTLPMEGVSVVTFWQDLLIYFYHGSHYSYDISFYTIQFLVSVVFIAGGIGFSYLKAPVLAGNIGADDTDGGFNTDYDI